MNEYLSLASIILPEEWSRALHAEEWLVFPENMGPHLCIDGTCLSTGEVYTIISNKSNICPQDKSATAFRTFISERHKRS